MAIARLIDICAENRRGTYLIIDGNAIRFGLAIRRDSNAAIDRWTFYIGLDQEEYSTLVEAAAEIPEITFLAMSGGAVNVTKAKAEMFLKDSPTFFVGTHKDHDDLGDNWSSASVEANLLHFFELIQKALNS